EAVPVPVDVAADADKESKDVPPRTEKEDDEDPVLVEFGKSVARFRKIQSRPVVDLESVVDHHVNPLLVNQNVGIVRSEARVEGVTVEQVLGTLMSRAARRFCKFPFFFSFLLPW